MDSRGAGWRRVTDSLGAGREASHGLAGSGLGASHGLAGSGGAAGSVRGTDQEPVGSRKCSWSVPRTLCLDHSANLPSTYLVTGPMAGARAG